MIGTSDRNLCSSQAKNQNRFFSINAVKVILENIAKFKPQYEKAPHFLDTHYLWMSFKPSYSNPFWRSKRS